MESEIRFWVDHKNNLRKELMWAQITNPPFTHLVLSRISTAYWVWGIQIILPGPITSPAIPIRLKMSNVGYFMWLESGLFVTHSILLFPSSGDYRNVRKAEQKEADWKTAVLVGFTCFFFPPEGVMVSLFWVHLQTLPAVIYCTVAPSNCCINRFPNLCVTARILTLKVFLSAGFESHRYS